MRLAGDDIVRGWLRRWPVLGRNHDSGPRRQNTLSRYRIVGAALALWLTGACDLPASIIVRDGAEVQVNAFTSGQQFCPDVAATTDGRFLVVWAGPQDAELARCGIRSQLFQGSFERIGPEFVVNEVVPGDDEDEVLPKAATRAGGDFVVVWEGPYEEDGSYEGIFSRRLDATGRPLGTEFNVNVYTPYSQRRPSVAPFSDGGFVVVWSDTVPFGSGSRGAVGRLFDADSEPAVADFVANPSTSGSPVAARVAAVGGDEFVVVWGASDRDGDGPGLFGRRFDRLAMPLGSEFQVNTYSTGRQVDSEVVAIGEGELVVAWRSDAQDGDGGGVFAQRLALDGAKLGTEFQVNTYTTGTQYNPALASDGSGGFVVVWQSYDQDGSARGVFGRWFAAERGVESDEFRVNDYTTGNQALSRIAALPDGRFVVVWQSAGDGDSVGVFARRFCLNPPRPAACGDTTCPLGASGQTVTVADALVLLRVVVGLGKCLPCTCDVDGSARITATDALIVLRVVVDQGVTLRCPPCSAG